MRGEQVHTIKKDLADGSDKEPSRKTIFSDMLTNPAVRPEEKTTDHLVMEAVSVMAASMNTITFYLTIITYHLLRNPEILARLREELAGIRRLMGENRAGRCLRNCLIWYVWEGVKSINTTVHEMLTLG